MVRKERCSALRQSWNRNYRRTGAAGRSTRDHAVRTDPRVGNLECGSLLPLSPRPAWPCRGYTVPRVDEAASKLAGSKRQQTTALQSASRTSCTVESRTLMESALAITRGAWQSLRQSVRQVGRRLRLVVPSVLVLMVLQQVARSRQANLPEGR